MGWAVRAVALHLGCPGSSLKALLVGRPSSGVCGAQLPAAGGLVLHCPCWWQQPCYRALAPLFLWSSLHASITRLIHVPSADWPHQSHANCCSSRQSKRRQASAGGHSRRSHPAAAASAPAVAAARACAAWWTGAATALPRCGEGRKGKGGEGSEGGRGGGRGHCGTEGLARSCAAGAQVHAFKCAWAACSEPIPHGTAPRLPALPCPASHACLPPAAVRCLACPCLPLPAPACPPALTCMPTAASWPSLTLPRSPPGCSWALDHLVDAGGDDVYLLTVVPHGEYSTSAGGPFCMVSGFRADSLHRV